MSLHLRHLQRSLPVLATHTSPVCVETKEELIPSPGKFGSPSLQLLRLRGSFSGMRKGWEDYPKFKLIALWYQYKCHHSDEQKTWGSTSKWVQMRVWSPDSLKSQVTNISRKLTETGFLPWSLNTGLAFPALHLSFQHHTFSLRHRTVAMSAIISTGIETFAQRSEATSLWLLAHVLHRELFILPLNYLSYTHRMEIISSERNGVDVTCGSDPAA